MAKKRPKRQPKKLTVDVVEARAFVLVDEYGVERASLSCFGGDGGTGGWTVIHINDDDGRPRLTLQVDDHGNPSLCLFTRNNSPGVAMAVNNGHGNGLSITDWQGKSCIMLGIPAPESNDPRGQHPDITVIDEQGRRTWSAFAGTYNLPDDEAATEA